MIKLKKEAFRPPIIFYFFDSQSKVITPFNKPMKQKAGFVVLKGNLFDSAIMKTSVISKSFKDKFYTLKIQFN